MLCKKPHEKRPIRGEITFFAKVPKTAIFGKIAKGGPREIFQKWPIGPPFAILPKMAVFGTFAKNVISPLIGLFSCGFLHSTNLG